MTASEMLTAFDYLYDKVSTLSAPGYTDDEKYFFLTKSEFETVLIYTDSKEKPIIGSLDLTEKTKRYLGNLIYTDTISSLTEDVINNSYVVDLDNASEDVLFIVSEFCNSSTSTIEVKPVGWDFYRYNLNNPYKLPDETHEFWRLNVNDNSLIIITDGTALTSYTLTYLKKPQGISAGVDSELDSSIHQEIVDRAVQIATGITNPAELQIKKIQQDVTK